MTFDLIHRFHEALIFLSKKIYNAVVAVAEETSYIYIVNTSIQKLGSEFYYHPTLQGGLGGSLMHSAMYCYAILWYCHVTVMIQQSQVSLIVLSPPPGIIIRCFFDELQYIVIVTWPHSILHPTLEYSYHSVTVQYALFA